MSNALLTNHRLLNVEKVIQVALKELESYEWGVGFYYDRSFFDRSLDEQADTICKTVGRYYEKAVRFLGKDTVLHIVKGIILASEYNADKRKEA